MLTLWRTRAANIFETKSILIMVALVILLTSYFIIPSLGGSVFASPDETAVARVAELLAQGQKPSVFEPLALKYPWLHARSWVSQGTFIVPVGFLGWPLLISPFVTILGSGVLPWIGALWLLSSLYPCFRLLEMSYGRPAAWVGVLVTMSAPAMILYGNRGLFPNGALLAAFLWSMWAWERAWRLRKDFLWAGLLMGMTVVIRPLELIWIMPFWLWMARPWSKERLGLCFKKVLPAAILLVAIFFIVNRQVYESFTSIGYWLHDNTSLNTPSVLLESPHTSFIPFGVHPRNIWWNLREYGKAFLWPSGLILLWGSWLFWRQDRRINSFALLAAWTLVILLLIYGSGLYQDHVRKGAVTVGNSFLRYLLPLTPLTGLAAAYVHQSLKKEPHKRVFCGLLAVQVVLGLYAVTIKDDEGILSTRRELQRYARVAAEVAASLPKESVILSERSDKIFVPYFGLRAVSPLPPVVEVARLVRDPEFKSSVALYVRPVSQRDLDIWRQQGIELIEQQVFGRERMYLLRAR